MAAAIVLAVESSVRDTSSTHSLTVPGTYLTSGYLLLLVESFNLASATMVNDGHNANGWTRGADIATFSLSTARRWTRYSYIRGDQLTVNPVVTNISVAGASWESHIYAISGVDQTTPIDFTQILAKTANAAVISNSTYTAVQANQAAFGYATSVAASTVATHTANSPATELGNSTSFGGSVAMLADMGAAGSKAASLVSVGAATSGSLNGFWLFFNNPVLSGSGVMTWGGPAISGLMTETIPGSGVMTWGGVQIVGDGVVTNSLIMSGEMTWGGIEISGIASKWEFASGELTWGGLTIEGFADYFEPFIGTGIMDWGGPEIIGSMVQTLIGSGEMTWTSLEIIGESIQQINVSGDGIMDWGGVLIQGMSLQLNPPQVDPSEFTVGGGFFMAGLAEETIFADGALTWGGPTIVGIMSTPTLIYSGSLNWGPLGAGALGVVGVGDFGIPALGGKHTPRLPRMGMYIGG